MANSPEGKSVANILTILKAQAGITPAVTGLAAARVSRYIKQFVPDDEFFQGLKDTGPWAHVKAVKVGRADQNGFYSYEIPIEVWYGLEAGQDNDGTTIEDMNNAIICALNSSANWPNTTSGPRPDSVLPGEAIEQDTENLTGDFIMYTLTPEFRAALAGAQ